MEKVYYTELKEEERSKQCKSIAFLVEDRPLNSKPDFICCASNLDSAMQKHPNHVFRKIINITSWDYVVGFEIRQ